jgi:4-amino-4-deoxy-L-arabinose transferase-like glycosyltransferase
MTSRSFRRGSFVIVLIGFFLRVAYALYRRSIPLGGDPYFYFYQGKALARGQGFIHPYTLITEGRVEQAADHPPLFSLFLALLNKIGVQSLTGQLLANCVVGSITIVLIMVLTRRYASDAVALLAGAVVAVYPNVAIFDGLLLTETWSMMFMAAGVLALSVLLERRSWRWGFITGLLFGLGALVRAEYLLAIPLIGLYLLVVGYRRKKMVKSLGVSLVVGITALATLVPWLAYNRTRFQRPVGMSIGFEYILPLTNCDQVYYGGTVGYWFLDCIAPAAARATAVNGDESIVAHEAAKDGVAYIKAHKGRAVVMPLFRVGRLLGLYQPFQQARLDTTIEGRELPIEVAGLVLWYLLASLSAVGLYSLRKQRVSVFPLVLPALVVLITAAITYGTTRFRAGLEPFVCVLAAVGVAHMIQSTRRILQSPPRRDASVQRNHAVLVKDVS